MENKEIRLGRVVQLRKAHPCGSDKWVIVRQGADIGLNIDEGEAVGPVLAQDGDAGRIDEGDAGQIEHETPAFGQQSSDLALDHGRIGPGDLAVDLEHPLTGGRVL